MAGVSKNRDLYEASLAGGLSPAEAEDLEEINQAKLEAGQYEPSDIPTLGAYIQTHQGTEEDVTVPAEDPESYVNWLLGEPGEFIPEWRVDSIPDYSFERSSSTMREKRDEYTLRTLYTVEDSLDQEFIDETVRNIVEKTDYRHQGPPNSADGNLSLLLGQYIGEIDELVEDENIVTEAYTTISETSGSSAMAAANVPIEELPEAVQDNVYTGGKEFSTNQITTRLRKMQGAGKCRKLEKRHEKALMGDNPTKNNTIIAMEDQLVGSLKHEGNTSMLALKDITSDGRQLLQKGMTYRVSHPMLDETVSERINEQKPGVQEWQEVISDGRMDEEQEVYQDWEVIQPERLELRPLRFAGQTGDYTVEGFRQDIETRREEIKEELGAFPE